VLLGLETASSGDVVLGDTEIQSTGVEVRDVQTVSSIQMVFQNPFDTLNPSHSVGSQIIRTLEKFGFGATVADRKSRMLELLDLVKLPRAFADRMPRQLSGGQKQRIGVARAFAGQARVVVADEPVSALDVSVQAAVTELLMDIQRKNKTTMLFISHDLSVVRYIADRVVVMYLGHIVEQGTTDQIFAPPYHPYTEALLSAIPIADTSVVKQHIVLEGDIPSAMNPPSGCPFQTRCRWKSHVPGNKCETQLPPLKDLGGGHMSLCWLDDAELSKMKPVITYGEDDSKPVHDIVPDDDRQAVAAAAVGMPEPARVKREAARAAAVAAAADKADAPARRPSASKSKPNTTTAKAAKPVSGALTKLTLVADKHKPVRMTKPKFPDDLKLISGVGPKIERTLHSLGVYTYAQVAGWKKAEREWVDNHLNFHGRIEREDWVRQAKALAKGGVAEYVKVFGKKPR
jgi:peptide/nickel transport system ATP-binding protein